MWKWMFTKVIKMREKVALDLGDTDVEKPFLEHLEDLRTMIVRIAVTMTVSALSAFVFYKPLMEVIFYPLTLAGLRDKTTFIELKVIGVFMAAMNVSIAVGIIVSCPLLLWFIMQFVLPGLRSTEKKVIFPALGVGVGLFLCGATFSYFVVTPKALGFFYEFNTGLLTSASKQAPPQEIELELTGGSLTVKQPQAAGAPEQHFELTGGKLSGKQTVVIKTDDTKKFFPIGFSDYVKLITQLILLFGLCFELPVVVMALVKLGILNYKVMSGTRSYAVIAMVVVSAIIAPTPDIFTLGLIAGPMIILYEICIWLAWWLEKRDRAANPDYYKGLDEDEKALNEPAEWDNENYNPWHSDDDVDLDEVKPRSSGSPPAGTQPMSDPHAGDAPVESKPEEAKSAGETATPNPEKPKAPDVPYGGGNYHHDEPNQD